MTEEQIWLELAELFFLDTEPSEDDFIRVSVLLREHGWSREKTLEVLITRIAPVAGVNLGYLIYPVIGEWATFEGSKLPELLRAHRRKNTFFTRLLERWYRRMIDQLGGERLLSKL